MQIEDSVMIGGFTTALGAIATIGKIYVSQLKKELAEDKAEFCAYKKESEKRFDHQRKHIDECNEDREVQATQIARLETALGFASSCDMTDCPRKTILQDSQRHTVRPKVKAPA